MILSPLSKTPSVSSRTTCPVQPITSVALDAPFHKVYNEDYKFVCILTDDLNHKAAGYGISLVLLSNNSDAWTKKLMSILRSENIDAIKLEMK